MVFWDRPLGDPKLIGLYQGGVGPWYPGEQRARAVPLAKRRPPETDLTVRVLIVVSVIVVVSNLDLR